MAGERKIWAQASSKADKARISARCEEFIVRVLVPRFLPEIRLTPFNYPIALMGRWRGERFSCIQRYRSGFPENAGEEFDVGFARLDHVGGERFDLMWHRHTGQWLCLHPRLTLAEALEAIETEELAQPR
ncbi:hypothetical protein [Pinisolibacter aquiterrae]|uniref:DUF3024 domain-containing protein n=1 Tax=Pinisolibacter aquiterrae TaxID=2815579 RepID=UPI001C3D00DF|nr:hypothetical protein [Pinisolibacter aquiterrae]MBV5265360.1 hypothetical protein [Pinisolibacter aquiterrae]MCC8234171.1 hypothetical protein [Pinisolibacter aquiterrae]